MQNGNVKYKISISEISKTLEMPYMTVKSTIERQSPKWRLDIIEDCINRLQKAKEKISKELQVN